MVFTVLFSRLWIAFVSFRKVCGFFGAGAALSRMNHREAGCPAAAKINRFFSPASPFEEHGERLLPVQRKTKLSSPHRQTPNQK
jgi:hypothetical protein